MYVPFGSKYVYFFARNPTLNQDLLPDIDYYHNPEDTWFLKLCQYHSEDSLLVASCITSPSFSFFEA